LAQSRNKNLSEFERLTEPHHKQLYGIAIALCRDPDKAADLVQERGTVTTVAGGQVDVKAEVPAVTTDELLDRYCMRDDEQLSFTAVEGCPCSELERALIYFLVLEWFYVG
jgi:hypothetical protein